MDKELTFYPETGRTRDLIYSEYSSCDRSIHLLVQEGPDVPYDFALKAYRETVSAYLSSADILPSQDFLRLLLQRFDGLCDEARLPVDQWKKFGIHLLLRGVDAAYVLTTAGEQVFLHAGGRMSPLLDLVSDDVERVRFDPGELQVDLFPRRFRDVVAVVRIGAALLKGADLVLGCARGDAETVTEGLSGAIWTVGTGGGDVRAARRSIVSPTISSKVLVVRFDSEAAGSVRREAPGKRVRRLGAPALKPRRLVVAAAFALVAVLIGVLWRGKGADTERVTSAQTTRPEATVREAREAVTMPEGRTEPAAGEERRVRLAEKWRTRYAKEVTSSPVLFEEAVIFGCRDGAVYALGRSTGAQLWKFVATAGVGSSPVISDGRVIVGDYDGNVFALEGRTGERIWSRKLPARVVSSPAVANGRLVVGCYDGGAYCLLVEDGAIVWTAKTGARVRGSVAASPGAFFVPSHDGFLYALAASTGDVMWRAGLGGGVSASPATAEGLVVVGGADRKVHCFDATAGSSLWTVTTGAAVESRAMVVEGNVLVGSNDGQLYCVRLSDGSVMWKRDTGRAVLGRPGVQDGVVYAGSYDGRIYAIELSTGQVLDTFDAGAPVYSSPVLDENHVFFGTNKGEFICLALRDRGTT